MSPSVILDPSNDLEEYRQDTTMEPSKPSPTPAKSALLHRSLAKAPLHVVSSQGNYLHLSNGQKIFDATGGAAVSCLGYGNERVQHALIDQMTRVTYCHSAFYGTAAAEDLAHFLIDSTGGEMARAFFISSGSEAMEAALKLARQYHVEKSPAEPQRFRFVTRQQSYHGTTLGALGVGGHRARRALFEPLFAPIASGVSPCYAYRAPEMMTATYEDGAEDHDQADGKGHDKDDAGLVAYVDRLEAELDAEFRRLGPDTIAAFVAEPVVGAALGCVASVPGYFRAVRRVCDRYGVLLIFDEVMCGAGRVGPAVTARFPRPLHAWQDPRVGVVPDIMTMGKGLGGGFVPVAAMLASNRLVDALRRGSGAFSHGQTYQGHALACRAALEVQRVIRDHDLVDNVRRQGALLGRLLKQKLGRHPAIGDIRGMGLFWGLEFVADTITKRPFPPSCGVATGIHELALCEPYNISLYPGSGCVDGRLGDHILLAPAYTVTSDDICTIVDRVVAVIEDYFGTMQMV